MESMELKSLKRSGLKSIKSRGNRLHKRLKGVLDPKSVLNPGKFL